MRCTAPSGRGSGSASQPATTGGAASAHHTVDRRAIAPSAKNTTSRATSITWILERLVRATAMTATPENQKRDPAPDSGDGGRHSATVLRIVSFVATSTT